MLRKLRSHWPPVSVPVTVRGRELLFLMERHQVFPQIFPLGD